MSCEQDILRIIKRAAMDAVRAENPMALEYGTVESAYPLTVRLNQKLLLTAEHLLLTDAVRDHVVSMTAEGAEASVRYTVHRALAAGEQVMLLRCDGGQRYIILDRREASA